MTALLLRQFLPGHRSPQRGHADVASHTQGFVVLEPHLATVCFPVNGIVDLAVDPLVLLRIVFEMEDERNLVAGGVALGRVRILDVALGRAILELRGFHPADAPAVRARLVFRDLHLAILVRGVVRNVIGPDNLVCSLRLGNRRKNGDHKKCAKDQNRLGF